MAGGILGGLFQPKTNTTTQNQTQTQDTTTAGMSSQNPWGSSIPLWNGILSGASGLASRPLSSSDFRAGAAMTRGIAGQGTPLADQAFSLGQGILSPDYAAGGGTDPEFTNLMDMLGSKASARAASLMARQGRGGGSEYGSAIARAFGEATAPLAFQNLENRRNRQLSVMGMAPGLEEARYAGADRMFGLDAMRTARPWQNYTMALPFALGAGRMGGTTETTGQSHMEGTGTTVGQTPGKSPFQGILGGALAGSQFGVPGALVGGVLGGLS